MSLCRILYILCVAVICASTAVLAEDMTDLEPPKDVVGPQPALFYLPDTDGSTSAQPLDTFVACTLAGWDLTTRQEGPVVFLFPKGQAIDKIKREFKQVGPQGDRGPLPRNIGAYKRRPNPRWMHSGTHSAYISLIHGQTDLIYVARKPSATEKRVAKRHGVELNPAPIAKDAFVFVVHEDNPVENLTLKQIRKIYTGKITNWQAVGGEDKKIAPYQRNPQSGSQQLMLDLVMKDEAMAEPPDFQNRLVRNSMRGAINAIDEDPAGIGYSVFFYRNYMQPGEHTKLLAINGVEPTKQSLASEAYPLTTRVYVDAHPSGKGTRLKQWLQSDHGQRVIAASGYVPLKDVTPENKTNK
jgi:ABC-type phosphate transport system substrate-binding protein